VNVLLCIVALVVFPRTDGSELSVEASLNALTFTPRWSIEPYPGYQVFLVSKLRLSHVFFSNSGISVGTEIGVANRCHLTYFESYAAWGVDDSKAWLMLNTGSTASFLARLGLPTGHYDEGIGRGAYWIEIYSKKARILGNGSVYVGYEWIGTNPDEVNYGDKIHLGLEVCNWLRIHSHYAFADQGAYYSLHDSPSFAIEMSVIKDFEFMKVYNVALVINQTILGRDIPLSTGISLRISGK